MVAFAQTPEGNDNSRLINFRKAITPADDGKLSIWNGDAFHTYPYFGFEKEHINQAFSRITDLMLKAGTTGNNLRIIPGNHTRLDMLPQDATNELIKRGILVPEGKLTISEPVTGINFQIQHGHELQPASHYYPGYNNPLIQRIGNQLLLAARRSGFIKPDVYPYSTFDAPLRIFNMPQWLFAEESYRDTNDLLVVGHTHVPEFKVNKRTINTGAYDPILNAQTELRLSPKSAELSLRSLNYEQEGSFCILNTSMDSLAESLQKQTGYSITSYPALRT